MKKITVGQLCKPNSEQIKPDFETLVDYIDIASVDNVNKRITGFTTYKFGEAPSRARKSVKNGSILVSTVRPNLNAVAVFDIKTNNIPVASTGFCVLDCKEDTYPRFLFNYLQSKAFVGEMVSQATGASYPAVSDKIVRSAHLPAYSYKEQVQIANLLDCVSNVIAKRKQQLKTLDELVKARFVELFGDQTANPYAWQQTSIGACCTLKSGTSLPADKENEGGAIPYVKVGDMNYPGNEQYITTSSRFVSEQTAGTGVFPVGTVVFPKRGGAIGTNKKRLTRLPICADLNVMGVTAGRRLTPQYLMAYFNTVDLGTLNNGSSVPQINNKDIAPLLICIPPMALQEQFAAFVEQTDKSKAVIQKALDEAQLLFDSLMQKYFG